MIGQVQRPTEVTVIETSIGRIPVWGHATPEIKVELEKLSKDHEFWGKLWATGVTFVELSLQD